MFPNPKRKKYRMGVNLAQSSSRKFGTAKWCVISDVYWTVLKDLMLR